MGGGGQWDSGHRASESPKSRGANASKASGADLL